MVYIWKKGQTKQLKKKFGPLKWEMLHASVYPELLNACQHVEGSEKTCNVETTLSKFVISRLFWEKAMAPHSSTLAWKISWTEEPGRLQSMGSPRVGQDWVTSLSLSLSNIGEGNGNPLQCSCLENPRDGGAWWAAIYGVAQSWTRLKRLSSSSRLFWLLNVWLFVTPWTVTPQAPLSMEFSRQE